MFPILQALLYPVSLPYLISLWLLQEAKDLKGKGCIHISLIYGYILNLLAFDALETLGYSIFQHSGRDRGT